MNTDNIIKYLQEKAEITRDQAQKVVDMVKEEYGEFSDKIKGMLNTTSDKAEKYRDRAKNTLDGLDKDEAKHHTTTSVDSIENAEHRAKCYDSSNQEMMVGEQHSAQKNSYVKGKNINNVKEQNSSQFANHNEAGEMESKDETIRSH